MKNKRSESGMPEREMHLEQKLMHSLHQTSLAVNDTHLRTTILLSRKEVFQKQNRKRISLARFLVKQIPLIGWKLWGFQAVFLLSVYGVLSDLSDYLKSPPRLAKLLFCLSIMVVMTALPLLYRSIRWQMQELETTTHFSLIKLLLARLIVIGIGDLSLLGGILLTALAKTSLSADSAVIYLCLPFLLSGSGCLFMLGHFPPGRFLAGSLLFCSALILVFAGLPLQCALLFHPAFSAVRIILCVLLFAFCAYQFRYIIKFSSYEEMQLISF